MNFEDNRVENWSDLLANKKRFEPMSYILRDRIEIFQKKIGATYRVRTDDLYLGKVSLYQLS